MKKMKLKMMLVKLFKTDECHNKKHYGANIISIEPPIAVCTKCGKKVKDEALS